MLDSDVRLSTAACRSARELLGLSEEELANLAQISVATLRRYETDGVQPNEYAAKQILSTLEREGATFIRAGANPTLL